VISRVLGLCRTPRGRLSGGSGLPFSLPEVFVEGFVEEEIGVEVLFGASVSSLRGPATWSLKLEA